MLRLDLQSRVYLVSLTEKIDLLEGLKVEQLDPGGFKKLVETWREKISNRTRRLAREWIRFDRTDPQLTRKFHWGEEQGADGTWTVVHDEWQEFPAKRRPG